jgi:hypothetical protein
MGHEHDSAPPWTVVMHIKIRFKHVVSIAENMDAAHALVRSQVEMVVNKAKAEAAQAGIEMDCTYSLIY